MISLHFSSCHSQTTFFSCHNHTTLHSCLVGVMENWAKISEFLETSNVVITLPSLPLPQMHHQVALP